MPGDVDLDDQPYEDMLSDDEELERKKEWESRRRRELLAKVDFSRCVGKRFIELNATKTTKLMCFKCIKCHQVCLEMVKNTLFNLPQLFNCLHDQCVV